MKKIAAALAFLPAILASTPDVKRNAEPGFVIRDGQEFSLDGKPFFFTATNAYWLHQLSDDDIDATFASIAALGLKVVTTWAFDDVVDEPPPYGTFFQLFKGDQITINEAGLQRLDAVVNSAEKHGIKLIMSLSNNWFPSTKGDKDPKPHGFLSNSYGGADVYVEQLCTSGFHDDFYTDPKVLDAFKNWVRTVVTRYVDSKAIFSWQPINDPRCFSTLPASPHCNSQTITKWTAEIAAFIKSLDCNHLVGSGDGGYYCVGCPKLYASNATNPITKRAPALLTMDDVHTSRAEVRAKALARITEMTSKRGGASLRAGLELAFKRQDDSGNGGGYDGSQGVDSEDIASSGDVDYSSYQYFPDQNSYGGGGYDNRRRWEHVQAAIAHGNVWIDQHAKTGAAIGKPTVFTGFGIVTQENLPFFVPFNSTEPFCPPEGAYFPTNDEQGEIYNAWLAETRCKNNGGVVQYQWSQSCLGENKGSSWTRQDEYTPILIGGNSPNDGYAATPQAQSALQNNAVSQVGSNGATG